MKSKAVIPSLDDLAFESRNLDYGAFELRKSYRRRLLNSFILAIMFFVLVLSIYPLSNLISPKIYDGAFPEYRVVDISLKYDALKVTQVQKAAVGSSFSKDMPEKIVDDDQVVSKDRPDQQNTSQVDSASLKNTGVGASGNGTSGTNGDDINGEVYGSADVNPQFAGGPAAMQQFITANFRYPEIANSLNISGTILIYVVIMNDGTLRDVKIIRGLHPELDAEAIRVVKSMPLWKPAKRAGVSVNVRCTIPITVSVRDMRNQLHK